MWRRDLATGLSVLALLAATPAIAAVHTRATRTGIVTSVTTPNAPPTIVDSTNDTQQSIQPQPATVTTNGGAIGGTGAWGYGNAYSIATAEPGLLQAEVQTEAQAVARPDSNVAGGAVATALAEFADALVFTTAQSVHENILVIDGVLRLTGSMYSAGLGGSGYVSVTVGGTGLSPTSSTGEWIGEMTRQRSATGVYSDWTPGAPTEIPFSFTVYAGQPLEVVYWLSLYASSGASFAACEASGGLCNVIQVGGNVASSDYGGFERQLTWHVTEVTNFFGTPVTLSDITSSSGFDYEVPEPGTAASLLAALGTLALLGRRARIARGSPIAPPAR